MNDEKKKFDVAPFVWGTHFSINIGHDYFSLETQKSDDVS